MIKNHSQFEHNRCVVALVIILGLAIFPPTIQAQGYMVDPMQLNVISEAGTSVEKTLNISSMVLEGESTIQLSTALISENSQGGIIELEPKNPQQNNMRARLRSCSNWLMLDTNTLRLRPQQSKNITLKISIPQNARGCYYAGVVAAERQAGVGQLALNLEFRSIVLILLMVRGPSAIQKIALTGTELTYVPPIDKKSATTNMSLTIDNQGETYAGINEKATLSYLAANKWRRVTQVEIQPHGIFPGVTLSLATNIHRKLPPGHYKINGQLYVDGRPAGSIDKDFDYAGDPTVTNLPADVELCIDPPIARIKASAGSMRSFVLSVRNLSDDTVTVLPRLLQPVALRAKKPDDIANEQFDCTKWLTLATDHLTLHAQGRTGLRIICNIPADAVLPHFYSQLQLQWKFQTGENAGEMLIPITVNIPSSKLAETLSAEAQRIDLVYKTDNIYAVMAAFINTGNTDFPPIATAVLVASGINQQAALSKTLESTVTRLIPRASVQFSGELDFAPVTPGVYALTVAMSYGAKDDAVAQLSLRVEMKDGKKVVTVIEQPAAAQTGTAPTVAVK